MVSTEQQPYTGGILVSDSFSRWDGNGLQNPYYEKWTEKADARKVMDMLESNLQMIYNELNKSVGETVISDYEEKLFMQLIWNIADRVFRDSKQ